MSFTRNLSLAVLAASIAGCGAQAAPTKADQALRCGVALTVERVYAQENGLRSHAEQTALLAQYYIDSARALPGEKRTLSEVHAMSEEFERQPALHKQTVKACANEAFADPAFAPIWSNAQRRQPQL